MGILAEETERIHIEKRIGTSNIPYIRWQNKELHIHLTSQQTFSLISLKLRSPKALVWLWLVLLNTTTDNLKSPTHIRE